MARRGAGLTEKNYFPPRSLHVCVPQIYTTIKKTVPTALWGRFKIYFTLLRLIIILSEAEGLIIQHQRHHQHQQFFIICLFGWFDDTSFCGRT